MAEAPGARPTALVVEDDGQIAHILRFILEREGFGVHVATDGRGAEKLIEELEPPAIITLDVMLPHKDGYALLALIRARAGWEKVPIVLLTARAQEKDIVRALDGGASDYLVKPFKPDELRARVRRLLKR
ncbi:MAG TPA: response regulator [Burkholderiales bacterium]|jgi:DNA-binding response OmpR family regulator|nr:response regulator [Burkholderiales bacterium]